MNCQVEKYVHFSDQNYQAIVEGLDIGIVFHDKEGALISANQRSAEIFDTTLENLYSGERVYSLWEITDKNGLPITFSDTPVMKALSTGKKQTNVVMKLQVSEGVYRIVLCSSQPLFEKDQSTPFSVVSTILDLTEDITDAYHAKQEVKKTNEHLLYLSNASSEAIWDWNMKTGYIFCNQALHDLIGSDLNEVVDLDWCYQCIHEEDRDKVEQIIKTVLGKKELSWETEYRFRNTDGRYKMIYNRGFIIYENDEPIRMVGSLQDISGIKTLETQLLEQKLKQIEEIRVMSKEKIIPTLLCEGLVASINDIVEDLHFINPFNISFTHSKQCDIESISKSKKITIFRIIQEQVKNIIKYSKAKNVELSLDCTDNQLRLLIRDDGIGFDSINTRRGLGLSNIYERTRLDNGKVILNTSPGHGCSLMVNIAMDNKDIFYNQN